MILNLGPESQRRPLVYGHTKCRSDSLKASGIFESNSVRVFPTSGNNLSGIASQFATQNGQIAT